MQVITMEIKSIRMNEPGTVLHGTMRNEDLLESFANELEHSVQRNAEAWCSDEGRMLRDYFMGLIGDAREADPDDGEACGEIIDNLFDALGVFAPEGHYFGAHQGDGSDYGYWPDWENEE